MPTHLAVITLDGDQMGRLLLGAPDRIRARWRDVLHPEAVAAIQRDPKRGDAPDWKIAWRATLEARRLMGPSLHAFVSRALRHFSNRVLPWVVEREFHGRLIYAGGDDALLLCPADEALPLLQRLDALFTATWVLDQHPDASTWVREEPDEPLYAVGSREARARFQVIGLDGDDTTSATARVPDDHRGARLFPMLGPHSSFSAGVSIGHFKTSLRLLRAHAGEQRDRAKVLGGRRVGVTWFTRSGPKVHAVLPLDDVPGGVGHVRELTARFSRGAIPGRLPYKLRETAAIARCAIDGRGPPGDGSEAASPDTATRVVTGLVQRALEGGGTDAARIARAWLDRLSAGDRGGARQADAPPAVVKPADQEGLGFLLLARALAGLDKEGE